MGCLDGTPTQPLGQVARLRRGQSITRSRVRPGPVPVVAGGLRPAYFHDEPNREGPTIVVAGSGANAGHVSWWEEPIFVSDAFSVEPDPGRLDPRFCYHFLKINQQRLYERKGGAGVPHLYPRDVAGLAVPVPDLGTQRRVAADVDSLSDLSGGLREKLCAELDLLDRMLVIHRRCILGL
ncbi:hypothetical protein CPHO_03945 [Corynebacterium phocae]|uniref:Type I restriction modification DNA specificity domain-containing protein n=1 Tax=Corynebacterium phocae TaxID=161895 RepID=A0A1L7D6S6_9CORY|nr:hypothetical protein CPHO_03945 [Corynebacterium phocae]